MALNLRTIPARLSSSAVAIVGIAGVVVVFVSVLSIAAGFSAAMQGSGSPEPRARHAQRRRQRDDERARRPRGRRHQAGAGHPPRRPDRAGVGGALRHHRSAEEVDARRPANVPMRGIEPTGMPCARRCRSIEGRMFQFGTNEVIVGRGASGQFVDLNVGDTIVSGQNRWQVVGVFEADGGVAETEIWCDARDAAGRLSARQHLSVGARAARLARLVRPCSATG